MLCVDMNCLYLTYRSHILGECHDTSDNKTDADGYGYIRMGLIVECRTMNISIRLRCFATVVAENSVMCKEFLR